MALRYISDDNLKLINNDNYHYQDIDSIPPFLQTLDDLCVIADGKDPSSWTDSDYNDFKDLINENLKDFINSFNYNKSFVIYLLDELMQKLMLLESDDKLLLDLRCLSYLIKYNQSLETYKEQLQFLMNLFKINLEGPRLDQSILLNTLDENKLLEVIFSEPFDLSAASINKLTTYINQSTNIEIIDIKDTWNDSIVQFEVSTHSDILVKYLKSYNKKLYASVKQYLDDKIAALTCLNSKSTSEDKADNYDDLKNIHDDLTSGIDDTINLGNDVLDTIYDSINNLPTTDDEKITDIKDTEDLHNTGIIIDQINNAGNEIKDTSRDIIDGINELENLDNQAKDYNDSLSDIVSNISENSGVDNYDRELQDIANGIGSNIDNSKSILIDLTDSLDKYTDLSILFEKLNDFIRKANNSYSDDIDNFLSKIYNEVMNSASTINSYLNKLLSFTNTYNLFNGKLDNILLLWNFLNNPSAVVKFLLGSVKAAIESVLIILNTFICKIKGIICFLSGLAKGIIDLINSIRNFKIFQKSIDNLINSVNTVINDISGASGNTLVNRVLVLSSNQTNKKINEMYPAILSSCNGDEEKATLFIDLFKTHVSSKISFSNIGQALMDVVSEELNSFLTDLKASIDNTIKNALGLTDTTECQMINLKPDLDFFKFRLNIPTFKLRMPDLDSKVIKC